jgi:hypothetical protein
MKSQHPADFSLLIDGRLGQEGLEEFTQAKVINMAV